MLDGQLDGSSQNETNYKLLAFKHLSAFPTVPYSLTLVSLLQEFSHRFPSKHFTSAKPNQATCAEPRSLCSIVAPTQPRQMSTLVSIWVQRYHAVNWVQGPALVASTTFARSVAMSLLF